MYTLCAYVGTLKAPRNMWVNFYLYKPSVIHHYDTCGQRLVSSPDRFSFRDSVSYTLCLEVVHCRIFLQIYNEHSLLPPRSVKEDSCLVAHDVVSWGIV
jgi:hypothetical protein